MSNQKTPIIIMGAHGGIGAAITDMLLDRGENLILTARDASSLSEYKDRDDVAICELDVTEPDSEGFKDFIEKAKENGVKGLAYCVGSIDLKPLKAAKDEDFLKSFDLNLLGIVRVLRALEKELKTSNASVVMFSTIAVQQGFMNHSIISASKGAVEGLTKSLAAEWAPKVRVNCIAPSLTDTAIAKPLTSSEQMATAIANMHPIPRLGKPEDSAAVAAMLISEDAGWITGQIFHVDGGRSTLRTKG